MIKGTFRVNKVFYRVSTIFQAVLLIAAFGIQEFSMKKMGMMRYVVFMNQKWEAQYPITVLQYFSTAFLGILSVSIILYALKKKRSYAICKKILFMLIVAVMLTLVFIFFTLVYSIESYRSYYFISLILGMIVLIQDLKTIVYLNR